MTRVLLSSTFRDLGDYRAAVTNALLRLGILPVGMETFGARPTPPLAECEHEARQCDALIAIIAHRYGWVPSAEQGGREGKSVTWLEMEAALSAQRPVFAFIVDDSYPWTEPREEADLLQPGVLNNPRREAEVLDAVKGLQRFKSWLRDDAGLIIETFTTPQDLAMKVIAALARLVERMPIGLDLSVMQARARHWMLDCLNALRYRRDWDAREQSPARVLFLEETRAEEVTTPSSERPLIRSRSAVLLTGDSGQGKSWQLYRLGYELAEQGQLVVLIQAGGNVDSDLSEVAAIFSRQIGRSDSLPSLRDLRDLVRRELPRLPEPWLTILIDGVRNEDYALTLMRYPWQELGLRAVLTCRWSERFAEEGDLPTLQVQNFTTWELSRYLRLRLGVDWIDLPEDIRRYIQLPLLAKLFCDLQTGGTAWRPINEYHLFERAWGLQTAAAPLAASAVAGLAARLPEEQIYPWPMARVWATGLRDAEIKPLVDSGLLRLSSAGRSLEIWHDRILNWAVAEGLVSALRSGEITPHALVSRAIQGSGEGALQRRLNYVAMDTLWLLTTPELGLDDAVAQFLDALEAQWQRHQLVQNLSTLGARIVPYLVSRLAADSSPEEEE